jgi:hypothetical protein
MYSRHGSCSHLVFALVADGVAGCIADAPGVLQKQHERRINLSHPEKDRNLQEKLPTAPLPQKNAVQAPTGETAKREEELLDTALESTFPASDPIAETEAKTTPEQQAILEVEEEIVAHEEFLLDEALEMTFPASDPIAIPDSETLSKAVHQQRSGH